MRISTKAWAKYIRKLAAVDQKAADLMTAYIEERGMDDADELIRYAYALATKYGEAAAAAACEMYDATAAAQGASVPPAEPAPTATYGEVAKAVNGTKDISEKLVPQAVSRTVKMAGADTMLQNAERDGAQFAWVPMGDTCAFCITLASRGWQYMSKQALKGGHAEHIHANCDCQYAIRFDGKSGVSGYDPDKYKKMYYGAEGSTPAEKIRAMRREHDAEHREKINAQKRAAYAEEKAGTPLLLEAESPFKHPNTPLTINSYLQSKHFVGGDRYVEYMRTHEYEPSILTITEKEVKVLVEKYHGTGILRLDSRGNIVPQEMIVDNDQVIGYAVNNIDGKRVYTTGFKIHYSDKGVHIVPMYENQKKYWLERRAQNEHDWLLRQKG